jgi:uncharacterized protein (TIGR02265 family)
MEQTYEPVVFTSSYESLSRALGSRLTPSAKARFKEHGVDFDKPLHAAYPLKTWIQSLELACDLIAPGKSRDEQTWEVGRQIVLSFTQTMVGKATFGVLRVLGPHRGLERMRRSLRMSNNYSETTLEKSESGYVMWCSRVTFPHYYRGVLEAGLESVGAKDIEVRVLSHDQDGARFAIRFS